MEILDNVQSKVSDAQCTGCAACMNICPQNAIAMVENAEGFLMPGVESAKCNNCGKCVRTCPAMHPDKSNSLSPPCYAFRADDSIRKYSSSGGAFTVLARHMLALGGYICGAVQRETGCAVHVIANSLDGIRPMRGSKYVQSNINFIYRQIKELLVSGQTVLFTGTPCQAAGLKAFLGENYASLYIVDVLCHGAPSAKILQRHLAEITQGRAIKAISFRDKRYGWKPDATTLRVDFANGEAYEGKSDQDPYQKAFLANLILRKTCADCVFCDYPRQGDMSLADFWWYSSMPAGDKEDRGTSLVLVNNAKGEKLLAALEQAKKYLVKQDVDPCKLPNRVKAKSYVHKARERFFDLINYKTFAESVRYCLDNYYDVGVVGPWANKNIGGFLTYYALYHAIHDMGYSPQMIESPLSADWGGWTNLDGFADSRLYPPYALCEPSADNNAMRRLNRRFGQFVVGSDQIFYPPLYKGWGKYMQLDWVEDSKKKIAYGASFGYDDLKFEEDVRDELSYYLQKFDAFGVREASGVKICSEQLGVEAAQVLDPVFICGEKYYAELAAKAKIQNQPGDRFLHGYILYPNEAKQKIVEAVCSARDLAHRIYTDFRYDKSFGLEILKERLNGRVRDMRDCNFTFTDSFHGLCFAIIFRKDFIIWGDPGCAYTRFVSILDSVDLKNRLVHSFDEFNERVSELLQPIDYDSVYKKLDPIIEENRNWLRMNLAVVKKKAPSDFDMAVRMFNSVRRQYAETVKAYDDRFKAQEKQLNKIIELMNKGHLRDLEKISSYFTTGLNEITNFAKYLEALYAMRQQLLIIISANDTPANHLDAVILADLAKLGLKENLNAHFRQGYIAVINGGATIFERIGTDGSILQYEGELNYRQVKITSAPYETGCTSQIMINGKNWSENKRGLNIVSLDRQTGFLLDSVNFDTFLPDIPVTRTGR